MAGDQFFRNAGPSYTNDVKSLVEPGNRKAMMRHCRNRFLGNDTQMPAKDEIAPNRHSKGRRQRAESCAQHPMTHTRAKIPLTIIVPVHDRQRPLERALASIAAQDVRPRAVIVVDDASPVPMTVPEALRDVLDVRLIRRDINGGPAAARNQGLGAVETEWISFLDSDDALLPQTLGARWQMINQSESGAPAPSVVYGCGWIDVDQHGKAIGIRRPRPSADVLDFAAGCWFSPGSCVVMNARWALAAAGGQDETLRRLEDLDWFLALARAGATLCVLPVVGAAIEQHGNTDPVVIRAAARAVRLKWRARAPGPALLSRLDAYLSLEIASTYYHAGQPWSTAPWLLLSWLHRPRRTLHLSPGWERETPATSP